MAEAWGRGRKMENHLKEQNEMNNNNNKNKNENLS